MKNVISNLAAATICGLSLVGAGAFAAPHAAHAGHHGAAMAKTLGLSPDQIERLKAVRKEAKAERLSSKKGGAVVTKATRKQERREMRAKVNAILTPAQRAKRDEMREARHAGRKPGK
jgi:Spy/CpxP family protein refolding chaperone